jgi:hypothetical protein
MELIAAVLGMGAGVLLDPVFLILWVLVGIFGGTLRSTLFLSCVVSVAVRILFFVIFAANDVALPDPFYMVAMTIITLLVGVAVSALVRLAKRKAMKHSSVDETGQ